ncbi:hypothetical protein [Nocardioides limicola]|uniref:hypothetical protein n=1 Tax=Nocardioides limicola TaxID=2803368 RepID=UPI00193BEDF6|nr:hypothetical protein [Nocardioides sp. DJM-14]
MAFDESVTEVEVTVVGEARVISPGLARAAGLNLVTRSTAEFERVERLPVERW